MGTVSSTLLMRMIDDVSGPARKIRAAMAGVDGDARKLAAHAGKGGGPSTRNGAMAYMAAGGHYVATAAGGYITAATAKAAYTEYADFDRKITRILITAEAGAEAAARTKRVIADIARETALPIGQVVEGLDSLVAAGRTLPDALAFLPSVARTAQATGAEVVDIAKTADALGVSMKIPAEEMGKAFDYMAKAGKLGKFELKDMARYLPSLLPLASSKGFKGMEGLTQVATYLQMIRQGTGTADEAADSFRDMLGKIASTETVNKFKKFGIDIKKELADVRKRGGNEFDAMFAEGGLLERALKKGAQVTDLFQDVQAYRGALAFRNALGDRQKMQAEVADAAGTVRNDLGRVVDDASSGAQRLSNAWGDAMKSMGGALHSAGLTGFLDSLAKKLDETVDKTEQLSKRIKEVGVEKAQEEAEIDRLMKGGLSREQAENVYRGFKKKPLISEKATSKPNVYADAEKELAAAQIEYDNADKAPKIGPFGYRSQMADRRLAKAKERLDAAKQARSDAERGLFPVEDYGATPGIDQEEIDRLRRSGIPQPRPKLAGEVGGPMPMPRPRPDRYDIPVQLDDASLDSEAQRLRARLQANFDANPLVLRARVEGPSADAVSYQQGQKVQSLRDGSYSDNGGRR